MTKQELLNKLNVELQTKMWELGEHTRAFGEDLLLNPTSENILEVSKRYGLISSIYNLNKCINEIEKGEWFNVSTSLTVVVDTDTMYTIHEEHNF